MSLANISKHCPHRFSSHIAGPRAPPLTGIASNPRDGPPSKRRLWRNQRFFQSKRLFYINLPV